MADKKISQLAQATQMDSSTFVPVVVSSQTKKAVITDFRGDVFIDPHLYGAKGDAVANIDGVVTGGTSLSSATYSFVASDVGKLCFVGSSSRTISSVSAGVATLSSSVTNGTGLKWLIGTDDTAAIEAAFDAAKVIGVDFTSGTSNETATNGSVPFGGVVKLRSGKGYLVLNTQVRYDAGKLGAICVPRRCGLSGGGVAQTHIYIAPGNIGHAVTNANSSVVGGGWDDFISLSDFSVFCNAEYQGSTCYDGVYIVTAANTYLKDGNYLRASDIRVFEAKRNGFYLSGGSQCEFKNLFSYNAGQYGIHIKDMNNSRMESSHSIGSQKTGIKLQNAINVHAQGCKAYNSGIAGSATVADCAGFALVGDSYLYGNSVISNCEANGARGSCFVVQSGMNTLSNCVAVDPGKSTLTASGSLPSVRAGFHLSDVDSSDANPKHNVFNDCYVKPYATINYSSANSTAISCGTHAVYLDPYGLGNKGTIWTFENALFSSEKVAGTGKTNGHNAYLKVDNVAMSTAVPDQVSGLNYSIIDSATVTLTWNRPFNNGSSITDFLIEYKLSTDGSYTTYAHSASAIPTVTITGLSESVSYNFRVSAISAIGTGATSSVVTATMPSVYTTDAYKADGVTTANLVPKMFMDFVANKYLTEAVLRNMSDMATFSRNSVRTVHTSSGYLSTVSAFAIALDYDPVTLALRGIPVEEGSQNTVPNSEDFSAASWTLAATSASLDSGITNPRGATGAYKIIPNTSATTHTIGYVTASGLSLSVWVKGDASGLKLKLIINNTTDGDYGFITLNPDTGAINTTGGAGYQYSKVTAYPGGWYRFEVGATPVAVKPTRVYLQVMDSTYTASFAGDGTSGVYAFGLQMENKARATSYIPTAAVSVTRQPEVFTLGSANTNTFASWYNQSEGTFAVDFVTGYVGSASNRYVLSADDNTANEAITLYMADASNDQIAMDIIDGGSNVFDSDSYNLSTSGSNYASIGYKASNTLSSTNEDLGAISLTSTMPTVDRLRIGSSQGGLYLNGWVKRIAYWNERLTDTEITRVASEEYFNG